MDRRKDVRLELRVGIAAGVALLLLAVIIFTVGKIKLGKSGYPVNISFAFVDAINPQADVLIGGGVKIGYVESIAIQGELIYVKAIIDRKVRIPVDAKFQILSKGLMGDKYLNVIPQSASNVYLEPGAQVEGMEPANMDKAFQRLNSLADSIKSLLGDPAMKSSLVDALQSFSSLARRLDHLVAKNEAQVTSSVKDFTVAAGAVRDFSQDLKSFSESANQILTPANAENLKASLANLKAVSGRLDKATELMSQGKGALGVLINDPQVGEDIKDLVKEVKDDPWRLLWKQ
jgi:phospholipid/cholesterol/gamma-HCH transport system substrate-binding protein